MTLSNNRQLHLAAAKSARDFRGPSVLQIEQQSSKTAVRTNITEGKTMNTRNFSRKTMAIALALGYWTMPARSAEPTAVGGAATPAGQRTPGGAPADNETEENVFVFEGGTLSDFIGEVNKRF